MQVTISVFFSGSNHTISNDTTLANLLMSGITPSPTQKKMGFDGCGETNGTMGMLFGTGLDKQCQNVIAQVEAEIKKGNEVNLNVYGHSRGGIAALLLAKQLSQVNPLLLNINLALLDAVPGNMITTSTLDFFDISLAKKAMDLRDCKPLKKVLALYPHQPLPAYVLHAPLFALYPETTQKEIDVIAGCHSNAQFHSFNETNHITFGRASFISFARIYNFFKGAKTEFSSLDTKVAIDLNTLDKTLLTVYQKENAASHQKNHRDCHSATGLGIRTKDNAEYFNLHHQRLAGVAEDKSHALVTIEENQGPVSTLKRLMHHHPRMWQALKWTSTSVGIASLIVTTSGLGLGITTLIGATALTGVVSAGAWYGLIKPLSQWVINRIFYPMYRMRTIQPNVAPAAHSAPVVATGLGNKKPDNSPSANPANDVVYQPVLPTAQPEVAPVVQVPQSVALGL